MKCTRWILLGMRKCASGEHLKRILCFQHFHATEVIDAHDGLSDICMLCNQKMWALISHFDWNRLPAAMLERHYLKNGCGRQNTECKCIDCVHATDYIYKCLIKCFVQTTVAPPSWSVYVRDVSLCGWLQRFHIQSLIITMLVVLLNTFMDVEKWRSWGVSRI